MDRRYWRIPLLVAVSGIAVSVASDLLIRLELALLTDSRTVSVPAFHTPMMFVLALVCYLAGGWRFVRGKLSRREALYSALLCTAIQLVVFVLEQVLFRAGVARAAVVISVWGFMPFTGNVYLSSLLIQYAGLNPYLTGVLSALLPLVIVPLARPVRGG